MRLLSKRGVTVVACTLLYWLISASESHAQAFTIAELLQLTTASESALAGQLQASGLELVDQTYSESFQEITYLSSEGERVVVLFQIPENNSKSNGINKRRLDSIHYIFSSPYHFQYQQSQVESMGFIPTRKYTDNRGLTHQVYVLKNQQIELVKQNEQPTPNRQFFELVVLK